VSPALIALSVTALTVAVGVIVVGALGSRGPATAGPARAWWRTPGVWVGGSIVFVLLGLLVFPRLLGFTFLLLPFIWMRAGGRRPGPPPRRPEE
jgi:hypothetical protein